MAALGMELLQDALAAVPDLVMVLNRQRQLVFANRAVLDHLGGSLDDAVGLRPGEMLGCVHSDETEGGCGTTESCRTCGIVSNILAATQGGTAEGEARITLHSGQPLDLKVRAQGIESGGERLTVFTLTDIAHEKRRRVLERVFFHDVLNTAGGVRGLAGLMEDASQAEWDQLVAMLQASSDLLVDEIQAHRLLSAAESQDYEPSFESHSLRRLLEGVVGTYASIGRQHQVEVRLDSGVPDVDVVTDRTLITRVLGNLVKNAIEASRPGMAVLVRAGETPEGLDLQVHSERAMSREVELQVFQRSFSTKGAGRGLGTYSVKMFTERYLGGSVWFETSEEEGTTFHVQLPLRTS